MGTEAPFPATGRLGPQVGIGDKEVVRDERREPREVRSLDEHLGERRRPKALRIVAPEREPTGGVQEKPYFGRDLTLLPLALGARLKIIVVVAEPGDEAHVLEERDLVLEVKPIYIHLGVREGAPWLAVLGALLLILIVFHSVGKDLPQTLTPERKARAVA